MPTLHRECYHTIRFISINNHQDRQYDYLAIKLRGTDKDGGLGGFNPPKFSIYCAMKVC